MSDQQPALQFKRKPCPQCGARTERQAETMCTQSLGYDDEYHCAGEFDAKGWSVQPTPESLKALDAWYDRANRRLEIGALGSVATVTVHSGTAEQMLDEVRQLELREFLADCKCPVDQVEQVVADYNAADERRGQS